MTEHNARIHVHVRTRLVPVNEQGRRIGEGHPRAIPEEAVAMIHELYESGMGYLRISRRLGISRSTVRHICLCDVRAQTPHHYKRVPETKVGEVAE